MDRYLLGYLLLAVCLLALAAAVARLVYNSPRRVYRRNRHADAARRAARERARKEDGGPVR